MIHNKGFGLLVKILENVTKQKLVGFPRKTELFFVEVLYHRETYGSVKCLKYCCPNSEGAEFLECVSR